MFIWILTNQVVLCFNLTNCDGCIMEIEYFHYDKGLQNQPPLRDTVPTSWPDCMSLHRTGLVKGLNDLNLAWF